MAQIIEDQGGFGAQFGGALGRGISHGLEQYAHNKLEKLHRRERTKKLERILPKDLAEVWEDLGPEARKQFASQLYYDEGNEAQQAQHQQGVPPAQNFAQQLGSQNQPMQGQPRSELESLQSQLQNNQQGNQQLMQQLSQQQPAEPLRKAGFKFRQPGTAEGGSIAEQNLALKKESNALKQEDAQLKREQKLNEFEEKKQLAIDKKYAKLTERFEKDYEVGSQIEVLADELLALNEEVGDSWGPLKEGAAQGVKKLTYGLINAPALVGTAGQRLVTKTNEAVTLLSNALRGLPSKFRVAILEASKPSLNQSYEARKQNILDLKKKGKVFQIPFEEQQKIVEENGGKLPADFSQRALPVIEKRQREILTGSSNEQSESEFDTLEEAQEYAKQHGAEVIENTETKKKYKV